ncbi:MAG: aminotransferase class III-fold pyridoxal phosphate-dependent enzyme [Firmicutes bacterium]|nr:aminotransferase class III-fold pyridoxal phosphate-dependent enzyme [Bacillota bacterium]
MIFAHFTTLARRLKPADDWRNDEAMAGGDAFFEEGIHWLHLANSLGPAITAAHGYRPSLPPEGPDRRSKSMLVAFRYDNGAVGALYYSREVPSLLRGLRLSKIFGRKGIITFECAFHGRTLLCMTLTSRVRPYKEGFGPFASDVYRIPSAYCYRCSYGLKYPGCGLACAEALERYFVTTVAPSDVAAMIIEPVQGEGGFIVPPPGYFKRLREICDKYGILLICDEVQTGFGRTGTLFAMEQFDGVEPDLMCVAKSIAAGLPLSGVIGKQHIMDAPEDSTIGGTYVGNPVACDAALRVLEIIEREKLLERSKAIGARLKEAFTAFQDKHAFVGDVRGLGAMVAIEFVKDRASKEPAPEIASAVVKAAMKRGLLLLKAGVYGNCIRCLAPLVITDEQLEEAIGIIGEVLDEVA